MRESGLKLRSIVLVLMLLLTLFTLFPTNVGAQQCIPIMGQRWAKNFIGVYVAGGVADPQITQVLLALDFWYSAQKWFIDSFEGGVGTPYLFYLTDKPGDGTITVSFFIGQNVGFAGRALNFAYTVPGNAFLKGEIQINLPPDRAANPQDLLVESVILHELGHGLGLGHTDVPEDAMYPVDNFPQNYGIPSTLDLYALYRIHQASDVAELGNSVCLPSQIGYGVPPWVQETATGFALSVPRSITFVDAHSAVIPPVFSVNPGETKTVTITVRTTGDYLVRLVAASAQTDFGQALQPSETLPIMIESGQEKQLSFVFTVPATDSFGTHRIDFRFGFSGLSTAGWSSDATYDTFSVSYEVTEPAAVTTFSGWTGTLTGSTVSQGGLPTDVILWVALIVVFVMVVLAVSGWSKRTKQPSRVTGLSIFCAECGTENPITNDYCGMCGKRLVAKPMHN
jgi:hypothetical protein